MDFQKEYKGYLSTPHLFKKDSNIPFAIFSAPLDSISNFEYDFKKQLRLGNRVEHYVFNQLEDNNYKIRIKNLQIIDAGKTIGEIDCIIEYEEELTHLEIVYKFYLYDESVGNSELDHWIGPNRKDSLVEKLTKLNERQLPLLHNETTIQTLAEKGFEKVNLQKVLFKAQLFIPFSANKILFTDINSACVVGKHISYAEIEKLDKCQFYIPTKSEWIQTPYSDVKWLKLDKFLIDIKLWIENNKSPMCWIKHKDNKIEKIFITWWSH